MKTIIRILLSISLAVSISLGSTPKDEIRLMTLSLEQSRLSPALFKNYVAIKMHMQLSGLKEDLASAISRYDTANQKILSLELDPEEKTLQSNFINLWKEAKQLLTDTPSEKALKRLRRLMPSTIKNRIMLAKHAQIQSGNKKAEVLLLISKLSMKAERFVAMYMSLKTVKDDNRERIIANINNNINDYKALFAKMQKIVGNTPETKQLQRDLSFYEFTVSTQKTFVPALIFKNVKRMTGNIDTLRKVLVAKL